MVQGRRKTAVEEIEVMCVYEIVSLYVQTIQVHTGVKAGSLSGRECVHMYIIHIFNELEMNRSVEKQIHDRHTLRPGA